MRYIAFSFVLESMNYDYFFVNCILGVFTELLDNMTLGTSHLASLRGSGE